MGQFIDRRWRVGAYQCRVSLTYAGPLLCRDLKVITIHLNAARLLIDNQCSSWRIGVMWWCLFVLVITRAADFLANCNLWIALNVKPEYRLLQ